MYLPSVGFCPPDPLLKYECIYFYTNVRIWIDLGEKYATKFGLLLINMLKIVDFEIDNNMLWNTHNAPDRTIFIIFFLRGGCLHLLAQV